MFRKNIIYIVCAIVFAQPLLRMIYPLFMSVWLKIDNYEYIAKEEAPTSLLCPYSNEENENTYFKYYYKNIYGCRTVYEYDNREIILIAYSANKNDIPVTKEDSEAVANRTANNLTIQNEIELTNIIESVEVNLTAYEEMTEYGSISSIRIIGDFYYKDLYHRVRMAISSPNDLTIDNAVEELNVILKDYFTQ